VKSPINLESPQQAPQAFPNPGAQAGTNRNEGILFNAILKNHMRMPGPDGATDKDWTGDLGQGLPAAETLMNLAPAFVAQQLKPGPKPFVPAQDRLTKAPDAGNMNADQASALAIWIAALAAAQEPPNPSLSTIGVGARLTGAGVIDPRLVPTNILPTSKLGPPEIAVPLLKPAPAPADLHAAETDKDPQIAPMVQALETPSDLAHCLSGLNATPTSSISKLPGATDKSKSDRQDLNVAPTLPSGKTDAPPPALQSQNSGSQSQSQTSSEPQQSRSGNESKKNQTFMEPVPAAAGKSQNASGTASPIDQASLNMPAQVSVHGATTASVQAHTESQIDAGHALNLREPGGIAAPESAPRIVHAAKLMEAAGQAEMRVSMKSETAGTVDVRAMLEGSHISATVAAQHGATRDWLLSNVHELHGTLSRDDLNLRTFEVTDSALQNEGRQTQSGQQEQQQELGAPAQFAKDVRTTPEVFSDLDTSETASQALSLHA
jgi:hypothetical protein